MSISADIRAPLRMIQEVETFYTKTTWMQHIVEAIRDRVKKNTFEGKDYKSKSFKKYSDAYSKRKGQRKVDLEVTQTMVDAITTKVITALKGKVFVKGVMGPDGKTGISLPVITTLGRGIIQSGNL